MRTLLGNPKGPSSDKNKVKEADTIKVPAFPHAESYRNWRIRTREAVMSASTDPYKAFDWISETWKEGQTLEVLRDVSKFTTLDAKLLSALTNILTGDFARKVDTYKETEATSHRYVRGRQVLLMMHEHFSVPISNMVRRIPCKISSASNSKVTIFVGSSVTGIKSWLEFQKCRRSVFWKLCSLTKLKTAKPLHTICRSITVPRKGPKRRPTISS